MKSLSLTQNQFFHGYEYWTNNGALTAKILKKIERNYEFMALS